MSTQNYPKWVTDASLSYEQKAAARISFLVRRAALHHNETGSVTQMAEALGVAYSTIYSSMTRGGMTSQLAAALELLVGRDLAPREELIAKEITV